MCEPEKTISYYSRDKIMLGLFGTLCLESFIEIVVASINLHDCIGIGLTYIIIYNASMNIVLVVSCLLNPTYGCPACDICVFVLIICHTISYCSECTWIFSTKDFDQDWEVYDILILCNFKPIYKPAVCFLVIDLILWIGVWIRYLMLVGPREEGNNIIVAQ